ncbi:MAG: hypothetical protein F6K40_22875 [Okeania sp. SIO3I5]|uniref:hypothetical protein n=1 Tax=Okeania sp. SIO3I5 TaxID=2607805 RepID=UPI0013B7D674|nr:hypothetical protein [Okeania sp. SIO3I5]NEQ38958.1 hypothetical protein [Okeania sp. SIO3I5]
MRVEIFSIKIIFYGKKKGKGELCKSIDKLCASLDEDIQFYLYLPFVKNDGNQRIFNCLFGETYLGVYRYKTNSKLSFCGIYETDKYLKMYEKLTGKTVTSNSLDSFVDIALEEWHKRQSI